MTSSNRACCTAVTSADRLHPSIPSTRSTNVALAVMIRHGVANIAATSAIAATRNKASLVPEVAWLFSRYARSAAWWMLPYLLWMPITAALKIWLWTLN